MKKAIKKSRSPRTRQPHLMDRWCFDDMISAAYFPLSNWSTPNPRRGFSLVEVTLALMVVAIGILAVMGLFPAGLDQNARSIADTRMAFFAEDVFNGLHGWAQGDWQQLEDVELPSAASNMWSTNNLDYITNCIVNPNIAWPHIINTNKYMLADSAAGIEKYALRYSLHISTNPISPRIKRATLWVWGGEFGTTNSPSIFYSEFFDWQGNQ